jgi:hypothetical protein
MQVEAQATHLSWVLFFAVIWKLWLWLCRSSRRSWLLLLLHSHSHNGWPCQQAAWKASSKWHAMQREAAPEHVVCWLRVVTPEMQNLAVTDGRECENVYNYV